MEVREWMVDIFTDIIVISIVLAGLSMVQFFKGRKINLNLMYFSMKKAEEALHPVDKNYTLVGIYTGYSAKYILRGLVEEAELVVLLMPRQALLYYPIALITSRFDRFYLRLVYRGRVGVEAHVIKSGYYRLGVKRTIRGYERMGKEEVVIDGVKYHVLYTSKDAALKLLDWVKRQSKPTLINHVALVPANNSLYLAAKLDVDHYKGLVESAYYLARSLTDRFVET